MSATELLRTIATALAAAKIPFMLTGSMAAAYYDLIIRKLRPFSETESARRIPIEFDGVRRFVASAEDVILSKLEWAKLRASARQLEDISALVRMQSEQLDHSYLERWIAALGLEPQWATALG